MYQLLSPLPWAANHGEARAVRRPVEFVHVHVRGRDLTEVAGSEVNESEALFEKGVLYLAGLRRLGNQRTGRACGVLGVEDSDGFAIGRPARRGKKTLDVGVPPR